MLNPKFQVRLRERPCAGRNDTVKFFHINLRFEIIAPNKPEGSFDKNAQRVDTCFMSIREGQGLARLALFATDVTIDGTQNL